MSDLFDPDDEDWADFQNHSPEYLLRVAGSAIRKYLGWHLSPVREETLEIPIGQRGLIMLPSRHVVDVESVVIADETLDPDTDFIWNPGGWIQTGQYYYRKDNTIAGWRGMSPNLATVTFTHGYAEVPLEVKQVAYEMTVQVMTAPVGNISQMSTPAGYRIQLSAPAEFVVNPGQERLLAPYRLLGVA